MGRAKQNSATLNLWLETQQLLGSLAPLSLVCHLATPYYVVSSCGVVLSGELFYTIKLLLLSNTRSTVATQVYVLENRGRQFARGPFQIKLRGTPFLTSWRTTTESIRVAFRSLKNLLKTTARTMWQFGECGNDFFNALKLFISRDEIKIIWIKHIVRGKTCFETTT